MISLTYMVQEKLESRRSGETRFMISASCVGSADGVRGSDLTLNDITPEQAANYSVGVTFPVTVGV